MSTPGVLIVGHTRASSAMLSVPVAPYSSPSAVKKDGRRDQVDGDVLECRLHLRARTVQRHQHERRDQHHLEPDVEVEQVAGQERTGDAHQQDLDQRVVAECFTSWIDACEGHDR